VQRVFSEQIPQSEKLMSLVRASQDQAKSDHQVEPPLLFGFLSPDVVQGLNEMNQWKDRTTTMETLQSQFEQLLLDRDRLREFEGEDATAFLEFIYKFISDINFKISISAIKIVSLLYQENLKITRHFNEVVRQLIEKLSDSKQSIRDITLDCCAKMIKASQPVTFANNIVKDLQHANWHVREGVVNLLVRCLLSSDGN
jgi:hypothetical protein